MNNTGEKTGYRVILLLVVGLTAFSSAMKELNQVQQLSLDASHLIAQWTDKVLPNEAPKTAETAPVVVKVESCEIQQSTPSIEPVQFKVRIAPDHDVEADELIPSEFPITTFKAKNRKQSTFRISTRDREMLLKTLNRNINLRAAG